MRIISSQALAALDSGRFRVRCLLRADIPSGVFAVWDDIGSITVGGTVYTGAAGRFTVSPVSSVADLSARNVDVTLSGLDSEAGSIVDRTDWHQRPILIQRVIISEDAPQVLSVVPYFSGFLDQMIRKEKPGGQSIMTFRCEAAARELSRNGARTRSDADQRQRDPQDGFFKFTASAVVTNVTWGRTTAPPPQKKKKFLGIF